MAITITPKYKPFTYEELVKPLEGYWEDYDKAEEELDKIRTDTATLRAVIDGMTDGEEKTKYTNFLNSLENESTNLNSQGLTMGNRKALKDLKSTYASLIPRLTLAEDARRKANAEWVTQNNSGNYLMDSNKSPRAFNVVDYLDGNTPLYKLGIDKKALGNDVINVAKSYASRIFPDSTIREVEEAGAKLFKMVQEQGINADLSQVEGHEQFMPILQELYRQYGIDEMTGKEKAAAEDYVNRKFWEGLVYKKVEDYQKNTNLNNDPSSFTVLPFTDASGHTFIKSGGQIFKVDGVTEDGTPIISKGFQSVAEIKRENEEKSFKNTFLGGYDQYFNSRVYDTAYSGKDSDEGIVTSIPSVVNLFATTAKNGPESRTAVNARDWTEPVAPENMQQVFYKVSEMLDDDTRAKLTEYNVEPKQLVAFRTGGNTKRQTTWNKRMTLNNEEYLGDNHITLMFAPAVISALQNESPEVRKAAYTKLMSTYNKDYDIYDLAKTKLTDMYKNNIVEKVSELQTEGVDETKTAEQIQEIIGSYALDVKTKSEAIDTILKALKKGNTDKFAQTVLKEVKNSLLNNSNPVPVNKQGKDAIGSF